VHGVPVQYLFLGDGIEDKLIFFDIFVYRIYSRL